MVNVGLGLERILASQEGRGHEDAHKNDVRHDGVGLELPAEHSEGIGLTKDEEGASLRDGWSPTVLLVIAAPLALHYGLLLRVHGPGNILGTDHSGLVLILHKLARLVREHGEPVDTEHLLLLCPAFFLAGGGLVISLDCLGLWLPLGLVLVGGQVVHSDGQEHIEEDEVTRDEENYEVHGSDGAETLDASVGLDAIVHHDVPILSSQDLKKESCNNIVTEKIETS